jgi:CMP-N-acetylneuraminic acid synthetase
VSLANQTPYKMWKVTKKNRMEPLMMFEGKKDLHSLPRQSLPKVFWQNGYIDIVRTKTVLSLNSMTGNVVIPFIHNENLYELDYPEDIPEVERALLNKNNKKDYPENNNRHSV